MSDCKVCDQESAQKAKEKLEQLIRDATDWGKRNKKKEVLIIMGKNCPAFCAADDPRAGERTILHTIYVV